MKIFEENIKELKEINKQIGWIHYDCLNLEIGDDLLFLQIRDSINKLIEIGEKSGQ